MSKDLRDPTLLGQYLIQMRGMASFNAHSLVEAYEAHAQSFWDGGSDNLGNEYPPYIPDHGSVRAVEWVAR